MKLSSNSISMLIFFILATVLFVFMAMRPAIEGNALSFAMPSSEVKADQVVETSLESEVKAEEVTEPVSEKVSEAVESTEPTSSETTDAGSTTEVNQTSGESAEKTSDAPEEMNKTEAN